MSGANKVTSHCQFARGPSGPGEGGGGGGHQGGAQLGILQQSLLAAMAGPGPVWPGSRQHNTKLFTRFL